MGFPVSLYPSRLIGYTWFGLFNRVECLEPLEVYKADLPLRLRSIDVIEASIDTTYRPVPQLHGAKIAH